MSISSSITILFLILGSIASVSHASSLPAPADAARIDVIPKQQVAPTTNNNITAPEASISVNAPEGSNKIAYELNNIKFKGNTRFSSDELTSVVSSHMGNVTLDHLWKIAADITRYYRDEGYFLSRAYVPKQELDNSTATIHIVEGYIGHVTFENITSHNIVIQQLTQQLKAQHPLSVAQLESYMLRLNDLGGINASGILQPLTDEEEGAVELVIAKANKVDEIGSININNHGSRFLGAYQATANASLNLFSVHTTNIYGSLSLPADELRYIGVQHKIPLYPKWEAQLLGSYVYARPGSDLSAFDIKSDAVNLGAGLYYKSIRQRQENLTLGMKLDLQNTNSDIFSDVALSRDRIRTLDFSANYNLSDHWNGYNIIDAHYRQGVEWFGASNEGNPLLTRADADPDFSVFKIYALRQQFLPYHLSLHTAFSAQISDAPLFSSEEFGYGGRAFGRAYNPSEITGDQGVSSSVELRYAIPNLPHTFSLTPYGFYDIGKIWEKGSTPDESASSAGVGMTVSHHSGISLDAGLALPLTKAQDTPLYGNGSNPRFYVQTRFGF